MPTGLKGALLVPPRQRHTHLSQWRVAVLLIGCSWLCGSLFAWTNLAFARDAGLCVLSSSFPSLFAVVSYQPFCTVQPFECFRFSRAPRRLQILTRRKPAPFFFPSFPSHIRPSFHLCSSPYISIHRNLMLGWARQKREERESRGDTREKKKGRRRNTYTQRGNVIGCTRAFFESCAIVLYVVWTRRDKDGFSPVSIATTVKENDE